MNTLIKQNARVLLTCVVLLFASLSARQASARTDIIMSEDFSGYQIPWDWDPSNSEEYWGYDYPNPYWVYPGMGDYNGSVNLNYYEQYYYYPTLTSPSYDISQYSATADEVIVEFDYFLEKNYYHDWYGAEDYFYVDAVTPDGVTTIQSFTAGKDYSVYADSYGATYAYEPSTYDKYWKHASIKVPAALRSSQFSLRFSGSSDWGYTSNFYLDNVKITGIHSNLITYSPKSIDFGSTPVDQFVTASVVVSNPNDVQIDMFNPTITGTGAAMYQIISAPSSVPAGTVSNPGTATIQIRYAPTQSGLNTAVFTMTTTADEPTTTITVNLQGIGLTPKIQVSATTLFLKTRTRMDEELQQSFTVKNIEAGILTISPSSFFGGEYPGEYRIVRLPSAGIAPGQSDTITIAYRPTMEGSRTATFTVVSNASNGNPVIQLRGIGVLPRLEISPKPLNFGNVAIGDTVCRTVTLTNPGTDTLRLTANLLNSSDSDFYYIGLKANENFIAPERSRQVQVCIVPRRPGTRLARLHIITNIPKTFESPRRDTSIFDVQIFATGVPYGDVAFYGETETDSTLIGQEVCDLDTLRNTGLGDLVITGLAISGTDAAEFSLSSASGGALTFPITLTPNQILAVQICSKPMSRGFRNASLQVTANAEGQPRSFTVTLQSFGQLACASPDVMQLFTNSTCIGKPQSESVTFENCGDVATVLNAIATGTGYSVTPATSALIAPGQKATFEVTFTPSTAGPSTGSLAVTGSAGLGITQSVSLNGSGIAITATHAADIPATQVSKTSAPFPVVLTNNGTCDWQAGTATVTGPYAIQQQLSAPIAAGGTGTVMLTFSPTIVGANSGTLTIDGMNFALSGLGEPTVSVGEITSANGFILLQNYPNPFNPTTEIRFIAPNSGRVVITLQDLRGEVIRTVFDGMAEAGENRVTLDAQAMASGAYFYSLSSGSVKITRQMLLTK